MKLTLITGGAGFIGARLCELLAGIAGFASWIKTQPVSEDFIDRSIAELTARNCFITLKRV